MSTEASDREALLQAGISPELVLHFAAQAVRRHQAVASRAAPDLSETEAALLLSAGALGISEVAPAVHASNVGVLAAEFAEMAASSWTLEQVAVYLEVTTSQVQQRLDIRGLYAIDGSGGQLCPSFQFDKGATLPKLQEVLSAIDHGVHPVAVRRFFLTPNPDLDSEALGGPVSPRDWLLSGQDPYAVIELAATL